MSAGQNQYGKAAQTVWVDGDVSQISGRLAENLREGIEKRFDRRLYNQFVPGPIDGLKPSLTYLHVPENKPDGTVQQLGLFDVSPGVTLNRAAAYILPIDESIAEKKTARMLEVVKTKDNPGHEGMGDYRRKVAASRFRVQALFQLRRD